MQFTFKIWGKIKEAWPIYKLHFGTLILLFAITLIVKAVGSGHNKILAILSYVVGLILTYIWIRLGLSLVDKKDFNPFSKEALPSLLQFWNLFKTMILYMLCVLGGMILLVIPGLYVCGRLIFAVYLSVEKNQGARVTVEEAWNMTKGYGWKLFWKSLLIGLFMAVGFIVFFVGGFVTYPIGFIVLLMMYREFSKMKLGIPTNPN
jgi:hypothetical protein